MSLEHSRRARGSPTALQRSSLRIATAPVNWNNDDLPDWRPEVPFPELLDAIRTAGYAATEFGACFPTDATTLRRELEGRALQLCGAYQALPLLDHGRLERAIEDLLPKLRLLKACGCDNLVIADELTPDRVAIAGQVPDDGSRSLDRDGVRRMAAGIALIAEVASTCGLRAHFHNHVGTHVETPRELDALLDALNPAIADLCFDTGHYAYGGGDPTAFVRDHADLIGYVHLKDVDADVLDQARRAGWSFLDALRHHVFCPLGEGMVDVPAIISRLSEADFCGWVVVEQDTCHGDSTETAAHNRWFLVDCCEV